MIPGLQDVAAGIAPASSRGTDVAVWVDAARPGQTVGPLVAGAASGAVGALTTFAGGALVAAVLPPALAWALEPVPVRHTA
ncbi:MAG TPA: hypothetical protein VHF25_06660 [Nitriliruptorales bacterium]|nr:hypothetical protein [Nitriliruptorales bacterium]